jgi:hypothetical protein
MREALGHEPRKDCIACMKFLPSFQFTSLSNCSVFGDVVMIYICTYVILVVFVISVSIVLCDVLTLIQLFSSACYILTIW